MQGRARALEGRPSGLAEKMTSEKGLEGERLHRLRGERSGPRAAGARLVEEPEEEDTWPRQGGGNRSRGGPRGRCEGSGCVLCERSAPGSRV